MKKITGLLLAAVLCMPAYAAQTKNTMKMVSYFPVPYVAYDTVHGHRDLKPMCHGHQKRIKQSGRKCVFVIFIR